MSNYDFCGYVTKYNILCSDGRTIMPGAFKNCDGKVVPLTDYRIFNNVLGRVLLENREDGVYGYGVFNNSQQAKTYQQMVEDKSIEGLGIFANHLKENDKCVTYAVIQSVMLCMHPANPQAKIDIINKQEMTELPQYHFDRADFVRVWQGVLDDSATDDVLDRCVAHTITDHFEMWHDEDEYYIKYLPNGVTINWYKGTHLGRTNTCTDPNFTLEDFEKFLVQLKRDIYGGETTNTESICCDNCYYYVSELSQCYGQKYCPVVDPNDHCEDFKPCKRPSSDIIKFNKIKEIIDNWAVDDDEHELLEKIADIVYDVEPENENNN